MNMLATERSSEMDATEVKTDDKYSAQEDV